MTESASDPHKLLLRVALIHTACKSKPSTQSVWANGANRSAEVPSLQRLTLSHNHISRFNCDAIYGNTAVGYAMLVGLKMTEEDVIEGLASAYPGDAFSTVQVVNCALDNANPKHASELIMPLVTARTKRDLLPLEPIGSQYAQGTISVAPYKEEQPSIQTEVAFPYASRLEFLEAEARRAIKEKAPASSIELGDPQLAMYPGSPDTMAETQNATIANAPPPHIFFEVEVNVDYNAETATFSARLASEPAGPLSEDDEAALAAVDAVNQKLKLDSLLVAHGAFAGHALPTESPIVLPIRPPETMKGSRKAEYNEWWKGVTDAYQSLLTIDKTGDESEFSQWLLENPEGDVPSYKVAIADQASNSSWSTLASKLLTTVSGATSKVWDTITTWGPKEMIGAYGGFTAIQKVKELPPWIWAVGAGILALIILK